MLVSVVRILRPAYKATPNKGQGFVEVQNDVREKRHATSF
jgi:hypothetical protein